MTKILASYGQVEIIEDEKERLPEYVFTPIEFTEAEQNLINNPRNIIKNIPAVLTELDKKNNPLDRELYLTDVVREEVEGKNVTPEHLDHVIQAIIDTTFFGYGRIGPLMRDQELEELMINTIEKPIFVAHRRYGMCRTNVRYKSTKELMELISWISKYANRRIDREEPLLDAHLPDGNRANVAIPPAAPFGPAVTIRKFKRVPYNIVDLIKLGTISTDLAAFLWVCVEGFGRSPIDIIISGGAGSGKTTLLNALAMFIPPTERIVTVEDTIELNINFLENWVQLEATPLILEKASTLSMKSLLKNSLRMRPDRVIVGEVRGEEAETLLVAMDIGLKGSMGTVHANNARETTLRLMEEPMNIPSRMIPLIELIIVMNRVYDKRFGLIRRITEVAEISGVERDVVQMGPIFRWDMAADEVKRTEYPIILKDKISEKCGITKKRLNTELYVRQRVLEHMVEKNIRNNEDVFRIISKYHINPKLVVSEIKGVE